MSVPAGDLLDIAVDGQRQQVRLYGIACPLKGQPLWQQAQLLVSYLTNHRTVEVTPLYRGPDGFENTLVRVEGVKDYLNVQLISYGMAWVRPNECSANLCAEWKAIEKLAKINQIGLWAEPNPTPPWEWKSQRRLKIRKHDEPEKDPLQSQSE